MDASDILKALGLNTGQGSTPNQYQWEYIGAGWSSVNQQERITVKVKFNEDITFKKGQCLWLHQRDPERVKGENDHTWNVRRPVEGSGAANDVVNTLVKAVALALGGQNAVNTNDEHPPSDEAF